MRNLLFLILAITLLPVSAETLVNNRGYGRYPAPMQVEGSPDILVVLVEFSDVEFSMDDANDFYERLFNEADFSDYDATGSVSDWFKSNSADIFTPHFDVYGPVKLDYARSYYGGNDANGRDLNPGRMVIEACEKLDTDIDFSIYDHNDDGIIDNVFVCYPGLSEEDGGSSECIWPHSGAITELYPSEHYEFDSTTLDQYACTAELSGKYNRPAGIGVYIHEISHLMGLPDLYPTAPVSAFTPGEWSVLDRGPDCNEGRTPPGYSSFELFALGWIDVEVISESGHYSLPPLNSHRSAFVITTDNPNEYFFIENRQRTGNDAFLPYHGMLVWHVDYDAQSWMANTVNNDGEHQRVDLIEADGLQSDNTRNSDSFPGRKKVTELGFHTNPALKAWSGKETGVELFEIEENDGIISFDAECKGISSVASTMEDESITVEWRDLSGRQYIHPSHGIWLKTIKRGDNITTQKIIL